jgi:hypothetical protein
MECGGEEGWFFAQSFLPRMQDGWGLFHGLQRGNPEAVFGECVSVGFYKSRDSDILVSSYSIFSQQACWLSSFPERQVPRSPSCVCRLGRLE